MKAHEKLRYVRFSIDCVRIRTYTSPITAADRPRAEEAAKEWGKTMKFTAHQINLPANVSVRPGQYARFSVCGGFLSVEDRLTNGLEIGRASCRERVCQYV